MVPPSSRWPVRAVLSLTDHILFTAHLWICSPSFRVLALVTASFHLDYSIYFLTGLSASILAPLVSILNTRAKTIYLKWKPDCATQLHLTEKEIQSPYRGLQGPLSSGFLTAPLSALPHLAYSITDSHIYSCFKAAAFVPPSCIHSGLAPSCPACSAPMSPSQRSLPRAPQHLFKKIYLFLQQHLMFKPRLCFPHCQRIVLQAQV